MTGLNHWVGKNASKLFLVGLSAGLGIAWTWPFTSPQNATEASTQELQAGAAGTFAEPLVLQKMREKEGLVPGRPWEAPQYENQQGALGHEGADTFKVPAGLEDRVDFWIDIYSKYTTQQGVLHDTKYINLVYEVVDFSDIEADESLDRFQKEKARKQRLKDQRKLVSDRLAELAKVSSPEGLDEDTLRYWNLFADIKDPNKFKEAAQKGRLRFQLGQKDRFRLGIYYAGRYIKDMEEIFRSQGLPIELTRLPYVESSFNFKARSKVGASGIWQFMRSTGKMYMKVSPTIDERNDPLTATRASARMLRDNYNLLRSWPLAITGYNHGPSGVRRLVQQLGTSDIVEIIEQSQKRRFGFASENFYACFLAALIVEKEATKYLGEVEFGPELHGYETRIPQNISFNKVVEWYDGDREMANLQNPHLSSHLRSGRWAVPAKTMIRVPVDKEQVVAEYFKSPSAQRKSNRLVAIQDHQLYRVNRGDTLSDIAREFGVSLKSLKQANRLATGEIRIGQELIIPR